jgi:shikimate kinase
MMLPFQLPLGTVFLVGMPGSGKTTIGNYIAEKHHRPFIDLDAIIENNTHQTISNLFAEKGETDFRNIESNTLKNLELPPNSIVSLGGGTPCFNNNLQWLKENGTIIYLKQPVNMLIKRLAAEKDTRPLLANTTLENLEEKITQLLLTREVYYLQADIVWLNPCIN